MDPQRYNHLNIFKMFDLGQRYFNSNLHFMTCIATCHLLIYQSFLPEIESLGLLVLLGFDITALTPVAYQRRSLRRPSWGYLILRLASYLDAFSTYPIQT